MRVSVLVIVRIRAYVRVLCTRSTVLTLDDRKSEELMLPDTDDVAHALEHFAHVRF